MNAATHKICLDRRAPLARGTGVRFIADAVPPTVDGAAIPAVWVQVTSSGDFRGYPGGRFAFDRATFETIVANFRRHPSYVTGGAADVVPWDFHHASEFSPDSGTIPVTGAPAQGWVRELEIKDGADGPELWALTRWLEPARTYIKEGRYKWASVVVDFAARDGMTNEKLGPTLISVAITNNPFVEGMAPLVAADKRSARVAAGSYVSGLYIEPACSPEDAFDKLKSILGMPATRSVGEVMAELMKLQEWTINGGAPLGVNLEEMLGAVRVIFNLPALASSDEVFAEASKLLGALLESANIGVPAGTSDALPPAPPLPASMPAASRNAQMNLLKILAAKLNVQETDAAVIEALEALLNFRTTLAVLAGVETSVSNKKLLEAGEAAGKDVATARSKLGAILGALGVADSDSAINKIAEVMEQSAKLKEVMPELEGLRVEKKAAEAEEEEKDVDEAMASKGITDDGVRLAFLALRRTDKKTFFEKNPKPEGAAASSAANPQLTRAVATTKTGSEKRIELDQNGAVRVLKPTLSKSGEGRISLAGVSGVNLTQKVIAWCKAQPGNDKLSYDDLFVMACKLIKEGKFDESSAA